ncbi:tripartite tricarboxylate transporter substrate-binding protein [Roseomonas sp. BN140053]|uniref:tripartite tricarboxylate transporter substrate-binding protein n=1 Tax=Roseomonas sp. BN140053 TaxID=3391898 RepID=UPI0039ECE082
MVAAEALAHARPDGQTALLLNNSHAASAAIFRRLPYDPVSDFAPATVVANGPLVVLTAPNGPLTDLAALIAAARARPEALNVATVGVGSTQHFVSAALEAAAGIKLTHVPYGSTPAALVALRGGEVQVVVETAGAVLGQLRANEARAVAVSSVARSEILPDVPSVAEAGLPGFDVSTWYMLAFPAGTPEPVLAQMQAEMARALAGPELRRQIVGLGLVPVAGTPDAARTLLGQQVARARELRAAAGIPQQ